MSKLNINNPFFQFMGTFAEYVLLNFIFLICCLPIVTIGAASTALYYVTMKNAREEYGYIIKGFFKSFLLNLKQSTIIWIIFLIIGGILVFNLSFWYSLKTSVGYVILFVIGVFSLIYLFALTYIFPILARYHNSVKQLIKNAPLIAIQNIKYTILLILCDVLIVAALYKIPQFAVFMLVFGFAFFAYCKSFIFVKVFKYYEVNDETNIDSLDTTDSTTEVIENTDDMSN